MISFVCVYWFGCRMLRWCSIRFSGFVMCMVSVVGLMLFGVLVVLVSLVLVSIVWLWVWIVSMFLVSICVVFEVRLFGCGWFVVIYFLIFFCGDIGIVLFLKLFR